MSSSSNNDNQATANAENEAKSTTFSTFAEKAKLGFSSLQERFKGDHGDLKVSRLSMTGLLKQARISFEKWVEHHHPENYPMPNGIVFLSSIKGSFGWGGEVGTGIVIYRLPPTNQESKSDEKENKDDEKQNEATTDDGDNNNNDNQNRNSNVRWSGPCAIGSGGVSFGLQIGISKVDHIIMLPRKHHVKTFAC